MLSLNLSNEVKKIIYKFNRLTIFQSQVFYGMINLVLIVLDTLGLFSYYIHLMFGKI